MSGILQLLRVLGVNAIPAWGIFEPPTFSEFWRKERRQEQEGAEAADAF